MKKYILLILCLLGHISGIFADEKSNAVLTQFSKKMSGLNSYSIDAKYVGEAGTQKVQIVVAGDKFLVCSDDVDVYANGKTKWSHMKNDNEVIIENQDNSNNSTITDNPKKIFENLEKSAPIHEYVGEEKVGKQLCDVVKLKESKNSGTYIVLFIDKSTQTPMKLQIKGEQKHLDFDLIVNSFVENSPVKSDLFVFDRKKFAKVQLVDLR